MDLVRRDEKYLRRDGLSTRDEGLCRISNLNSQFVNLICISTFVLAYKRLSTSRLHRTVSADYSVLTPVAARDNFSLLRESPYCSAALTTFLSAQPQPPGRRATSITSTTTNHHLPLPLPPHPHPNESTGAHASLDTPRHHPVVSRSPAVTSRDRWDRSNDRSRVTVRVSGGEGKREERIGGERREEREMRREGGDEIRRKGLSPSKPPTPPPPLTPKSAQDHPTSPRTHRPRRRRRRRRVAMRTPAPTGPPPPNPNRPRLPNPSHTGVRAAEMTTNCRRLTSPPAPSTPTHSATTPPHPTPKLRPGCKPPNHTGGQPRKRQRQRHHRHLATPSPSPHHAPNPTQPILKPHPGRDPPNRLGPPPPQPPPPGMSKPGRDPTPRCSIVSRRIPRPAPTPASRVPPNPQPNPTRDQPRRRQQQQRRRPTHLAAPSPPRHAPIPPHRTPKPHPGHDPPSQLQTRGPQRSTTMAKTATTTPSSLFGRARTSPAHLHRPEAAPCRPTPIAIRATDRPTATPSGCPHLGTHHHPIPFPDHPHSPFPSPAPNHPPNRIVT
jgi:hypothetical protein